MADLRGLLTELGYEDVKTHLMSGNALFTSPKTAKALAQELEQAIDKDLCAGVKVVVRSRAELAKVVADNPLADAAADGSKFLVVFLSAKPDPAPLKEIDPADFIPEEFAVGGREIYLWCRDGIQDSKLNKALSKKLPGVTATARNWNTVTKLLKLASS